MKSLDNFLEQKDSESVEPISTWKIVVLKDVLTKKGYIRGPFGSSLIRAEMKSSGIPVYEQANAIYNHREFRYFIDEYKYVKLSRFTVEENDVIISCSGTIGKVSLIKKDDPKGIISQALLILRPNTEKMLPKFLQYFFMSEKGYSSIISRSSGSVQVNIADRQTIEEIELYLPSLEEQRFVVSILDSLTKKIKLNSDVNYLFESLAHSLFHSWFVRFDPFQDGEFEESELGKIPKGWKVMFLEDVIEINPKRELKKNEEYKKVGMSDITPNQSSIENYTYERYTGGGSKFRNGDTLLARITPCLENGKTAFVDFLEGLELGFGSTEFIVLSPKKQVGNFFIYCLARDEKFRNFAVSLMTGTSGRQRVQTGGLKNWKLPLPENDSIIREFEEMLSPLFNKIRRNSLEKTVLSSLRALLLPQLLSGKLRVNNPAQFLEEIK